MRIRAAGLLDLATIERIHRQAEERIFAAPPPVRLWSVLSFSLSSLLPLAQETLLYVAEVGGEAVGFVQASSRPFSGRLPAQARTLQVINLSVLPGGEEREVAEALIEHLCDQAHRRGVHRLFVRVPRGDRLLPSFMEQGFRQYAGESVLFSQAPRGRGHPEPPGLRPQRGRDLAAVYHLYRRVTPGAVASLEAPSFRDWRVLQPQGGRQEVVERTQIVAWSRVLAGDEAHPTIISALAAPEPELVEALADHLLEIAGPGPAWSSLRHYDSFMIDALRGRGFSELLYQVLLVRETLARETVAESRLVPLFG